MLVMSARSFAGEGAGATFFILVPERRLGHSLEAMLCFAPNCGMISAK
jgi:hypothetical protein